MDPGIPIPSRVLFILFRKLKRVQVVEVVFLSWPLMTDVFILGVLPNKYLDQPTSVYQSQV